MIMKDRFYILKEDALWSFKTIKSKAKGIIYVDESNRFALQRFTD